MKTGKLSMMERNILFIQGGGEDGYHADKELVSSLQEALADGYHINYPELRSEKDEPAFSWPRQIGELISAAASNFLLAGHSFGASMILKYFSENICTQLPAAIFLLATPFWKGDEDWQQTLRLRYDFAEKLPRSVPMFFYHCRDDEEVPFAAFGLYKQQLAHARFHAFENGGHLFNPANLHSIADDIRKAGKSLK